MDGILEAGLELSFIKLNISGTQYVPGHWLVMEGIFEA
jgi:hypothetical protein